MNRPKTYKNLLWDLDGTLTDPAVGITAAAQHALRRCGVDAPDRRKLTEFIGPPLMDAFREMYGFTEERTREACGHFREYYNVTGLYENRMYDGVDTLLDRLAAEGMNLYVATSKPSPIAQMVLEHFDLARRFIFIGSDTADHRRPNKAAVIDYVMRENGIDKDGAVMIGDRKHDVIGARATGIDSIGVLYGYGSREELEGHGATHVAATVEELGRLLLGQTSNTNN